jgi:hypothetical protein
MNFWFRRDIEKSAHSGEMPQHASRKTLSPAANAPPDLADTCEQAR